MLIYCTYFNMCHQMKKVAVALRRIDRKIFNISQKDKNRNEIICKSQRCYQNEGQMSRTCRKNESQQMGQNNNRMDSTRKNKNERKTEEKMEGQNCWDDWYYRDDNGTRPSGVEEHVEAIRQQWRDRLIMIMMNVCVWGIDASQIERCYNLQGDWR